jgi:hypothetical protein
MAGPQREESRQLLKHWQRFRNGKRLPEQDDIRWQEMQHLAPNIFILNLESENRLIWSYVGDRIKASLGGHDLTGQNFLAMGNPIVRQRTADRIRLIFEFGYAACTQTSIPSVDGRLKITENLLLPVERSSGGIRRVYGSIFYVDQPDYEAKHGPALEELNIVNESFIDLGNGYAAIIDVRDLPFSAFPCKPE